MQAHNESEGALKIAVIPCDGNLMQRLNELFVFLGLERELVHARSHSNTRSSDRSTGKNARPQTAI